MLAEELPDKSWHFIYDFTIYDLRFEMLQWRETDDFLTYYFPLIFCYLLLVTVEVYGCKATRYAYRWRLRLHRLLVPLLRQ